MYCLYCNGSFNYLLNDFEINKENCFLFFNNKFLDLNETIKFKDISDDENINNIFTKEKIIVEFIEEEKNIITDMSFLFDGVSALLPSSDFSKFNTINVTNMSYMFFKCESLKSLPDISNFNTSNVINMTYMFGIAFL